MAMWPFRRRGSRMRAHDGEPIRATARRQTEPRNRLTKPEPESHQRAYSFSPGRRDSIRHTRPTNDATSRSNMRRKNRKASTMPVGFSHADELHRAPTLHHGNSGQKRRGQPLPAKKSSKRRKEDHEREAEIKAMSQFTPLRPSTDAWTKGRSVKKDNYRLKSGASRSWDGHHSSVVSLPSPESIHSSMSSDSDHISFKVSALAALAPRPTLRCSSNPTSGTRLGRSPSDKRRFADREPIDEATLKAHKRVEDLADGLDASDLRELMERDQRRRDRQREKEIEKAAKRLARRKERQRMEAAQAGTSNEPPQNLERGVLGREMTGSVDPASVTITSARRRLARASQDGDLKGKQPDHTAEASQAEERSSTPLDNFHRVDSGVAETQAPMDDALKTTPQHESRRKSLSPSLIGFIRSRTSGSKSPPPADSSYNPQNPCSGTSPSRAQADYAESAAKTSDSGSAKLWLSFFKWRRRRRSSDGPASFSNTSRDSMQGSQTGPPPVVTFSGGRRLSSGVPKRTMSRFREDLPEHPLSPPDSRVASSETDRLSPEPLPQIVDNVEANEFESDAAQVKPIPIPTRREGVQPSPAPHSMSLASIDSEGSWLSGRMSRQSRHRPYSGLQHPLGSASAVSEVNHSDHTDDDSVAGDEYLNKVVLLSPTDQVDDQAHASSDDDSSFDAQWGTVSRKPTVVRGPANKRSREGLLVQSFTDSKDMDKGLSDSDEAGSLGSGESRLRTPQQATSVQVGHGHGHTRNFSAGSAKLLEISAHHHSEEKKPAIERVTQ